MSAATLLNMLRKPTPDEVEKLLVTLRDPATLAADSERLKNHLAFHGLLPDELMEESAATSAVADPDLRLVGTASSSAANPQISRAPANIAAERAVLGCMAIDRESLSVAAEMLIRDDFTVPNHRTAFFELRELAAAGKPTDVPHLNEALAKAALTEPVREDLIASILGSAADPSKIRTYCELVQEKSRLREMIRATTAIAEDAASGRYSPAEIVERNRARLAPLISAEAVSGWDPPILDGAAKAAPFPLDVLPPQLAAMVSHSAADLHCPPDFVAVPCLVAASGAMGRSVALAIKRDWCETAILWTVMVGTPGTSKSQGLKRAMRPLWEIQARILDRYMDELGGNPRPADPKDYPHLERLVVADATREALADLLAKNPRGLLMIRDELAGWIAGMNEYKGGSGSDLPFYLQLFFGTPILVDRRGHAGGIPVMSDYSFLSVIGPMVPTKLDQLIAFRDGKPVQDGFIDRLLLTYPERVPYEWTWNDDDPKDASAREWSEAINRLYDRPMVPTFDDGCRPHFITFDKAAKKAWESWITAHMREAEQSDFPPFLEGPWSKYRTYCARLMLIVDQLHWAYDPSRPEKPRHLGAASAERGIRLLEYFKAHFRRVLTVAVGVKSESPDAEAILDWCVKSSRARFTEREAADTFRRRFQDRPEDLKTALRWMVDRRWIRRVPPPPRRPGRLPSETYEVSPSLLRDPPKRPQNSGYSEHQEAP